MNTRVLIIHQSTIVAEGLQQILQNSGLQLHDHLRVFNNPANVNIHQGSNYVFIASLSLFQSLFNIHLRNIPGVNYKFIQLITDQQNETEETNTTSIYINDTHNQIVEKTKTAIHSFTPEKITPTLSLTERETEVLKLVSLGNASKEIADKLNISTHTVITHRKNITEKLGIKSISGLTVYAILNKIIDTDELSIDDLI